MRPTVYRFAPLALALLLVTSMPALAGVVYEIEVKDHESSPPRTESIEAAVEGRHLKMGIASGGRRSQGEMIFRGDRREMIVVDHDEDTYTVMNKELIGNVAGQVGSAMSQMQEALKNVPKDQRDLYEKMMKERFPQAAARAKPELRKTGEHADRNGYPCVKYEVLRDGKKVRELWVTSWSNIEGGAETAAVFRDMASFFQEILDAIPSFGGPGAAAPVDNPFTYMDEMEGFPVVTREFNDDGSLESEATLRGSQRRVLDLVDFEPPAGYKRQAMFQ